MSGNGTGRNYTAEVGRLLRAVRNAQGMSLRDVQVKSGGVWSAAAVGSYERGGRGLTVGRLAQLADFYDVPLTTLIPATRAGGTGFEEGWQACAAQVRAALGGPPAEDTC